MYLLESKAKILMHLRLESGPKRNLAWKNLFATTFNCIASTNLVVKEKRKTVVRFESFLYIYLNSRVFSLKRNWLMWRRQSNKTRHFDSASHRWRISVKAGAFPVSFELAPPLMPSTLRQLSLPKCHLPLISLSLFLSLCDNRTSHRWRISIEDRTFPLSVVWTGPPLMLSTLSQLLPPKCHFPLLFLSLFLSLCDKRTWYFKI